MVCKLYPNLVRCPGSIRMDNLRCIYESKLSRLTIHKDFKEHLTLGSQNIFFQAHLAPFFKLYSQFGNGRTVEFTSTITRQMNTTARSGAPIRFSFNRDKLTTIDNSPQLIEALIALWHQYINFRGTIQIDIRVGDMAFAKYLPDMSKVKPDLIIFNDLPPGSPDIEHCDVELLENVFAINRLNGAGRVEIWSTWSFYHIVLSSEPGGLSEVATRSFTLMFSYLYRRYLGVKDIELTDDEYLEHIKSGKSWVTFVDHNEYM